MNSLLTVSLRKIRANKRRILNWNYCHLPAYRDRTDLFYYFYFLKISFTFYILYYIFALRHPVIFTLLSNHH